MNIIECDIKHELLRQQPTIFHNLHIQRNIFNEFDTPLLEQVIEINLFFFFITIQ